MTERNPPSPPACAPSGEQWKTRVGCILAVAGSAVGLGNFLRFPGQVVENGGGAFMIPYFCALLLLGIPIGWAEWTMGRYGGRKGFHSTPAIMGVVTRGPFGRYFGVLGLLIPLVIYMYYGLIESWCLRYAWGYFTGSLDLGTDPSGYVAASSAFFGKASGIGQDGVILEHGGLDPAVIFWVIVFATNIWLIHRGLEKGIELFCSWAMPALGLCAAVVLVRVLTLGTPNPDLPDQNVVNGLGFVWNPDLSKLGDFKTWLAAAGQIFFSLSVGFGVIVNYASYLRDKDDVVLSGLTASATNELVEVGFGGLITVTAAFVFLGAGGTEGGTFALGFNTLPVVFAHMGPMGRWVGGIWFFMLFLAAITSSLSMLQPVRAFLEESLGLGRTKAVAVLGVMAAAGSGWVIWFSKDLAALGTMDFWVGTVCIFVLASFQIIAFSWVMGLDRGLAEAHRGAEMRIPHFLRFVLRWVAPLYLLVVFGGFCVQTLPGELEKLGGDAVGRATLAFVGVVALILVVMTAIGAKRWRAAGLDLDGRRPDEEGAR